LDGLTRNAFELLPAAPDTPGERPYRPRPEAGAALRLLGAPTSRLHGGSAPARLPRFVMARRCQLTGKGPVKGSRIWRSGKPKKQGGIGTHVTAITKRRFFPNLQRVKAVVNGRVRYIRVAASAIKKGLVIKPPKRNWSPASQDAAKTGAAAPA